MTDVSFNDLTTRARNCMYNEGIKDWEELHRAVQNEEISQASLLRVPNFGRKALNDLVRLYKIRYGTELDQHNPWIYKHEYTFECGGCSTKIRLSNRPYKVLCVSCSRPMLCGHVHQVD